MRKVVKLQSQTFTHTILAGISGLILPLVLIPVASLMGSSTVIEEIAKTIVIIVCILPESSRRNQLGIAVLFGALFGLSESCLYLNQIVQFGDAEVFWRRLLFTMPMHILTACIILLPTFLHKHLVIVGFGLALLFHLVFNSLAASL